MASALFSSIQSLSTNVLKAIRGTPSTSHQQQDPPCPVTDQQKSVREDLEKLSRMLRRIQALLKDAEEREIHDESVQLWLAELRGVGYQAEDVLDEFYYEVQRSYHRDGGTKRKYAEMYASSSHASYSFTNITKASILDGMAKEIKGITKRFEEISNDRMVLQLREEDGTRLIVGPHIRPPTSSHVDERAIFGREEEKEKIIGLLNLSTSPDFMVLPIVGMGGVGKTTLAQLVYSDSRICRLFNKKCWISVSEDFNLVRLTKAIVESVSNGPCQFSELSKLQDVLKEKISSHGLFLVLDDVWNEQRDLWERFRVGFLGAKFVRILMTTRNTSVANIMQTTTPFQLSSLPKENCWSLFKHFAFGSRETSENANLHEIGRGIVKKCKGSPLAIKALGGILRYQMDEEKWREILESDISEIDEAREVMPALRLSYQKLPQHLKPCFLYLSMFPKDFNFEKNMVIRLWMAQGYINGDKKKLKTLEEIGSEYFDELEGRSLVNYQYSSYYILHDLIHDLARSVSQEAYCPVLENDQEYNGPCKVCHMYFTKQDELLGLVPSNYRAIRTFVKQCWSEKFDFPNTLEIACARALHLRYCSSLPNTFGTLKHLRYLSVENTETKVVPESLCLLYNLQTLALYCNFLGELPENMKNLSNLRYFKLNSEKIQHLPESLCLLYNLQTLVLDCNFLGELPEDMKNLSNLRYFKLNSEKIQHLPETLFLLYNLQTLVLDCNFLGELPEDMKNLSNLRYFKLNSEKIQHLPETLCLLYNLQTLVLDCNFLGELPENMKNLSNLRYFKLNSEKIQHLPETLCLLYNLQTLVLDCNFLGELPENMKNLSNLRYFKLNSAKIQHLPESIFPLPNLQTLSLKCCDQLDELPKGIEQSTTLQILDLPDHTNMPFGGLRVLKDMNKLSRSLCISGLNNIVDVELCRNANLASKPNLYNLILSFSKDFCGMEHLLYSEAGDYLCHNKDLDLHLTDHSSNNAKSENDEKIHNVVLESLQPHGNLSELAIIGYEGRVFPSWLLNSLLPKLSTIALIRCEPNYLPPFGQLPHLRILDIVGSCVRNLGDEPSRYSLLVESDSSKQPKKTSYPSLERLSLQFMHNLVEWQANDGDFLCLEQLFLESCPKLWKIPTIPQNVKNVTFLDCPKLKFLTCPSVIKDLEI